MPKIVNWYVREANYKYKVGFNFSALKKLRESPWMIGPLKKKQKNKITMLDIQAETNTKQMIKITIRSQLWTSS